MEEIFKDVVGYEGLYQVSNLGNVKSLPREVRCNRGTRIIKEKILNPVLMTGGYLAVNLYQDRIMKQRTIHQLVAEAFLNHTPCGYKLVIDHINENKLDNRIENLQIVTSRFNISKSKVNGKSKYTGVTWHKIANKWYSSIYINGKCIHLGLFKCELAASVAYQKALVAFNNGKEIKLNRVSYSSQYTGVAWHKIANKWMSGIYINGKRIHLGLFEKEYDAHVAYQNKLLSLSN